MSRLLQFCDTSMFKGIFSRVTFHFSRRWCYFSNPTKPGSLGSSRAPSTTPPPSSPPSVGPTIMFHHSVPSSCKYRRSLSSHKLWHNCHHCIGESFKWENMWSSQDNMNFLLQHHPASTLSLSRFLRGFWFLLFGLICFPLLNSNVKILWNVLQNSLEKVNRVGVWR